MNPNVLRIAQLIVDFAIGGLGLAALTELLKRLLLKLGVNPGWKPLGYVASAATCLAVSVLVLLGLHEFTVFLWIASSFIAWLIANGFYKLAVKAPAAKTEKLLGFAEARILTSIRQELRRSLSEAESGKKDAGPDSIPEAPADLPY